MDGFEDLRNIEYYSMDEDDDDFDGEDDDNDGDLLNYSGSDVSSEESVLVKPEYVETTEFRFHSVTQSPCGRFGKWDFINLKWYGVDNNAKFIYGVIAQTFHNFGSKFLQIVKFCPVTSGFYVDKQFDGKLCTALGFDEISGTFFIAKSGTVPNIVLYNATADFEARYRVKNGVDILYGNLGNLEALSCIGRQEWIVFSYALKYFRRVVFDEDEKCVSMSECIDFPDDVYINCGFIPDQDTVIFVGEWKKILVYNLENGQFNVEDFTIDGITNRPGDYCVQKLNVNGNHDFYVSSQFYGVLKLDFPAKKWRRVNFFVFVDFSIGDVSNLVDHGDFSQRFKIGGRNCTLIAKPKNGCFCALFTEISTNSVVDKKQTENGDVDENGDENAKNCIAQIVCCLSSSFSLQDLCLSKLFGEFRKNKGAEIITDIEFCNQLGISPNLIQKYIGSGV